MYTKMPCHKKASEPLSPKVYGFSAQKKQAQLLGKRVWLQGLRSLFRPTINSPLSLNSQPMKLNRIRIADTQADLCHSNGKQVNLEPSLEAGKCLP